MPEATCAARGGIGYWKPGFLDEECAKEKRKGEFLSGHEEAELSGRQGWVMSLEGCSSQPAASLCGPPASGLLVAAALPS